MDKFQQHYDNDDADQAYDYHVPTNEWSTLWGDDDWESRVKKTVLTTEQQKIHDEITDLSILRYLHETGQFDEIERYKEQRGIESYSL
jgi:hypothetical protein